jgi:hypothetical protein
MLGIIKYHKNTKKDVKKSCGTLHDFSLYSFLRLCNNIETITGKTFNIKSYSKLEEIWSVFFYYIWIKGAFFNF